MWQTVQETISYFKNSTGLKVNYQKSTVYRLGSSRDSNARFYSARKLQWSDGSINVLGILVTHSDQEMIKINIDPVLEKTEGILSIWKERGLSLIGKVLILNSLIASLFVYKMAVLPLLGKSYYERVNRIMSNFLWESKRERIPIKTLQGHKLKGGLGLVNFEKKDKALKINWLTRLKNNSKLAEFAYALIGNKANEKLWYASLSDMNLITQNTDFWADVLKSWYEYTESIPESKDQILAQQIWVNSSIRIDDKPVYWKNWADKGINLIKDLVANNGDFLSHRQLNSKFEKNFPFTEYFGLMQAIPQKWKAIIKNGENIGYITPYTKLQNQQSAVKTVYSDLIDSNNLMATAINKWKKEQYQYDSTITSENLTKAIANIYKITNSTKLRSFQYRFLQKALVTNAHLTRYKIKPNNWCSLCEISKETIFHLFFDCVIVKTFWAACCNLLDIPNLNYEQIVYNNVKNNPNCVENAIVLRAKMYIYGQ